jgi:hypothetical protein
MTTIPNDDDCWCCTFAGCWQKTSQPFTDGWTNLGPWGPGIPEGWYCKPHAAALEALEESGELDRLISGLDAE